MPTTIAPNSIQRVTAGSNADKTRKRRVQAHRNIRLAIFNPGKIIVTHVATAGAIVVVRKWEGQGNLNPRQPRR